MILNTDGGQDENPTGRETRFLQIELLMGGPTLDTKQRRAIVGTTTRQAGGSALNKVERLNGEMTRATSNFHALGDVVGPLIDDATGQADQDQLHAMWKQHAEEYRNQLDGNCGLNGSTLAAFHGATLGDGQQAKMLLERRPILLVWLDPTTSKKKMGELKEQHPIQVAHFEKVKTMQEHVEALTHYSSFGRCCLSTTCNLCRNAPRISCWYDGGPALKAVPSALRDPERPGHYLEPEQALMQYAAMSYKLTEFDRKSPSDLALAIYERTMGKSLEHFPDANLAAAAKEINDCRITSDVLKKHFNKLRYIRLRRLEGARKAVETKKANKEKRAVAAGQSIAVEKAANAAAEKAVEKAVEKAAKTVAKTAAVEKAAKAVVEKAAKAAEVKKKAVEKAAKAAVVEKAAKAVAQPAEPPMPPRAVEISSEVICADCTKITGLQVPSDSCIKLPGGYFCLDELACKERLAAPLPKRRRI